MRVSRGPAPLPAYLSPEMLEQNPAWQGVHRPMFLLIAAVKTGHSPVK
ncbi:hypothetical protein [Paenibacillus camerounensis]|nr:hypothetical protein [Paenibacillus camerounensis]